MTQSNVNLRLLELLLEKGAITRTSMRLTVDFCRRWQTDVYDAIVETNLLSEAQLSIFLAEHFSLDRFIEIETDEIRHELMDIIRYSDAKKYFCLPISCGGTNREKLTVVVPDPTDEARLKAIQQCAGKELILSVAGKSVIVRKIHEIYPPEAQINSVWMG